ncbi:MULTISPECIES: GTP cyclohydrolase II [unclassified Kocuria]|uniref:GTP cyclohydrolase II n=1 Tax=unclassified Kocuria TaxID=2649579 RepID=UPI0037C0D2B9
MTASCAPDPHRSHESSTDQGVRKSRRVLAASEPVLIPMEEGRFSVRAWQIPDADGTTAGEHLSLTATGSGQTDSEAAPLVRLHSECLTGDVFGSYRCDCGPQLHLGLERIAAEGGTVVYLRRHEGRGIGLVNKLRAYQLQDGGADTVEANELLGLPAEARDWGAAATILHELGLQRIRLLSNNPIKAQQLRRLGIEVTEMVHHEVAARPENHDYLAAKRDRMEHRLLHVDD